MPGTASATGNEIGSVSMPSRRSTTLVVCRTSNDGIDLRRSGIEQRRRHAVKEDLGVTEHGAQAAARVALAGERVHRADIVSEKAYHFARGNGSIREE